MAAMENPAVAPTPPERSGSSEFETLLADLGATYEEPTAEAIIARKDAEIAELRKNLLALRPMGDELAEANKAVLANEAASTEELAETRARLADERVRAVARKERLLGKLRSIAGRHAELQAQCDELGTRLRRAEGDLKRTRGWHHKAKARAEEKNRVAADRWREILRLRREIRDLRKRLDLPG